ncbi:MAG: hypothetical protein KDD50_11780 [Bdellovibrionales bacterium]|nr:hypothetical protein [Bdellovibrionales bacterium]
MSKKELTQKDLFNGKFNLIKDEPVQGPDGWPYLLVEYSSNGSESLSQLVNWLKDKGVGLVVNPNEEHPDFVFTYGMVWNALSRGNFFSELEENSKDVDEIVEFSENQKISFGPPNEEYLPEFARKILKDFFNQQKIDDPKILMISPDNVNWDLCFSLESLGNPPEDEHQGILEAIAWFLPADYSLVLVSEANLPEFLSL